MVNFSPVGAQTVTLVTSYELPDSYPFILQKAGNLFFFIATDASHGTELWRSDGTAAGTFMVNDINPGVASSIDLHVQCAVLDDQLFFFASDGVHGRELWKTDGTTTEMIYDIVEGDDTNFFLFGLQVGDDNVFFAAAISGKTRLFRSDGTTEGTIALSTAGFNQMKVVQNAVYFFSYDHKLIKTDGTVEGTVTLKEFGSNYHMGDNSFESGDDVLYFWFSPYELWKTDGTAEGTVKVSSFVAATSYPAENLCYLGSSHTLFFTKAFELWKTDGTEEGTVKVKNLASRIRPETLTDRQLLPTRFCTYNGHVYFIVDDGYGIGLWKSDGTESGTVLLRDGDFFIPFTDGRALYAGTFSGLWKTNGSYSSTYPIWNGSFFTMVEYKQNLIFLTRVYSQQNLRYEGRIYQIEVVDNDADNITADIDCDDMDPQQTDCTASLKLLYNGRIPGSHWYLLLEEAFAGIKKTFNCKISNEGNLPLDITSVSILDNKSAAYSIPNIGQVTIQPGDSLMLPVDFQLGAHGSATATLQIISNDKAVPTRDIFLYVLAVDPPQINLKNSETGETLMPGQQVNVGKISTEASALERQFMISVRNDGKGKLDLHKITLSQENDAFSFDTLTVPATIPQGTFFTLPIKLDTVAVGTYQAMLSILSSDPYNNNYTLELLVEVILPVETEQPLVREFEIYPNPSRGLFHVKTEIHGTVGIKVKTAIGKTLVEYDTRHFTEPLLVDLQNSSDGFYLLQLSAGGRVENFKLIKSSN